MRNFFDYKNFPLVMALIVAGLLVVAVGLYWAWRPNMQAQPAPKPRTEQQNDTNNNPDAVFRPTREEISDRLDNYFGREVELNVYHNDSKETHKMKFEDYLVGVVAGEVGPDAPDAAMAAQAILARTFTLDQITSEENPCLEFGTPVCTDPKSFQAYAPEKVNEKVRRAVDRTRGQVLLYERDVIYALYSAHAGGRTATKEESFPDLKKDMPYLSSVESPDDEFASDKEKTWQLTISRDELANKLNVEPSQLTTVQIEDKGPSGRALTLNFGGVSKHATEVRMLVGPDEFRSTLLTEATMQGDEFRFAGKGWGHGAGLSQWGAITLANNGKTAAEIVKFYYPKTELAQLWR